MDVKEAVRIAKEYIGQLFESEGAQNVGLEEVEYEGESCIWYVTVGLSRPWDREQPPTVASIAEIMGTPRKYRRDMKVVAIEESTGRVLSVKNRE